VETEAKTEAGGVETETEAEAVKIAPRGCLEARQCLEAPHHWKYGWKAGEFCQKQEDWHVCNHKVVVLGGSNLTL